MCPTAWLSIRGGPARRTDFITLFNSPSPSAYGPQSIAHIERDYDDFTFLEGGDVPPSKGVVVLSVGRPSPVKGPKNDATSGRLFNVSKPVRRVEVRFMTGAGLCLAKSVLLLE